MPVADGSLARDPVAMSSYEAKAKTVVVPSTLVTSPASHIRCPCRLLRESATARPECMAMQGQLPGSMIRAILLEVDIPDAGGPKTRCRVKRDKAIRRKTRHAIICIPPVKPSSRRPRGLNPCSVFQCMPPSEPMMSRQGKSPRKNIECSLAKGFRTRQRKNKAKTPSTCYEVW